MEPLVIESYGSISSLGFDEKSIVESYNKALVQREDLSYASHEDTSDFPTYKLSNDSEKVLTQFVKENELENSDRVIQLACYAASQCAHNQKIFHVDKASVGVAIGTARGSTDFLERHLHDFISLNKVKPSTSPSTTMGLISATVAKILDVNGQDIAVSMTCASAFHALFIAIGSISSGLASGFYFGGAEAPLTPFTVAQMKALRIYGSNQIYPCRSFAVKSENSMVLGEGASVFYLKKLSKEEISKDSLAKVLGIGFSRDTIANTSTGIDINGSSFISSMNNALTLARQGGWKGNVDALIVHAPGTKLGDLSEYNAIKTMFPALEAIYTTKHLTGHTFGASAGLSLELALLLLQGKVFPLMPYATLATTTSTKKTINTIIINSAGFGGACVSVLVGK
jgi:3-oxoacyl-[acyl-carrier-protein] synthase II